MAVSTPIPRNQCPGLDKQGVSPFTFPLQALDFKELGTMPGHWVTWPQLWAEGDALQGGDISQSLVKGHHVGGEVQGRQTARGAAEPPLLLAGGRARAPDQGIHLQGGVQEGVWFLHKQETALRPPLTMSLGMGIREPRKPLKAPRPCPTGTGPQSVAPGLCRVLLLMWPLP